MGAKFKVGDRATEINYQGEVEVIAVKQVGPDTYHYYCIGSGWDLPEWDDPTICDEEDLIPLEKDDGTGTR